MNTDSKECADCGQPFGPNRRDRDDPEHWNRRRYCGRSCAARGSQRGRTPPPTLPPMPEWGWQERGTCRGGPLGSFYPEGYHGKANKQIETQTAARYCTGCPVRAECLITALRNEDRFGVWGGTTPKQRAAMLKTGKGIPA